MRYEWFIAKRYLRPQGGATFIFHLTLISITGVALGVVSLITVLSVMNGFANDLRSKILQGRSHIILNYSNGIENYHELIPDFKTIDNVAASTPVLMYRGVIYPSDTPGLGNNFPYFVGIDPRYENEATGLQNNLLIGDLDALSHEISQDPSEETIRIDELAQQEQKLPGIIIGKEMAADLFGGMATTGEMDEETQRKAYEYYLGQRLTLITVPLESDAANMGKTNAKIFEVVGIFETGHYEFDSSWCYISIPSAQYLLNVPNKVTHILFWLDNYKEAATAKTLQAIKETNYEKVGHGYASSWMQFNQVFFNALKIEKRTMDYILKIIILVATFNIIATLFMIVTEKTRDIGLLRAIGAGRGNIRLIFISLGLIVGLLGTSIGIIGGYTLCSLIQAFPPELPGEGRIYYLQYLPCEMEFFDFISVSIYTTCVSFLASIYPAFRASRFVPVDALRFS